MTGKCECKMCKKCKMQRNVETVACVFQAWNPASEEQCIDRCHRLGQTRKVVVTKVSQRKATITFDAPLRFVCISDCSLHSVFISCWLPQFIVKDSVEERMVEIQRKKQDLLEKAFGSSSSDRKTSRINDIKALLEMSDAWGRVWLRLHACNRGREVDSVWLFALPGWELVTLLCIISYSLSFVSHPVLDPVFPTSRLCIERGDKQSLCPNRGVNLVVERYCLLLNAMKQSADATCLECE